jgi:Tol biopolymer transport system component
MFSFDGQWIYYSSLESGIYCVFRIGIDGKGKTQLTFPGPGEEDARVFVSHDGNWFIYNKRIGSTIEIRSATI